MAEQAPAELERHPSLVAGCFDLNAHDRPAQKSQFYPAAPANKAEKA